MKSALVIFLCMGCLSATQAIQPIVAIHDSELTRALETLPADTNTPTGAGTTGNAWWPTAWHYFVMPDSIKEALSSDGTAFTVVSDANISAGNLLDTNGRPNYPIVISLATEAIGNAEIAQLTNYVAAGGFLFVGSSAFTRNTNGTTRGDFAFANELGLHMVKPGLTNWSANSYFFKQFDHSLIAHIPEGELAWHMLRSADACPDPYPTHPPGVPNTPHMIWQVQPSDAVVIAWGDAYPYLSVKKFGNGYFIYDAAMQPLLGVGGFSPVMYSYGIFRNAIEWAFQSANLPVTKLSPWPYRYDAAVIFRHDMEAQPYLINSILRSAQFESTNGVTGDYYFCTGALREDMPFKNTTISNLLLAVSLGATIGPHNGGLTNINPYVPPLTTNDYDYWHWGPDDILDTTNVGFSGPVILPSGYASTTEYARASLSNAFTDIEGWGLTNSNLRTWVAPYFNAGREASLQIEAQLNVKTAGEQKVCPFPHWTRSMQTSGLRYPFISLPTSDWYVGTAIAQAMENGHTIASVNALIDYYYNLGGLINLYSHSSSDGSGQAGNIASDYVTYSMSKPRIWSANAEDIYTWWLQRSNAQITASFATNGNQSVATISITGASDTNTAVEIEAPSPWLSEVRVMTNGVITGTNNYRINRKTIKLLVGTSVTNVVISYTPLPVAQNASYHTGQGNTLNVSAPGLLSNASNLQGSVSAVLAGGPANGTLTFPGNGSFSYSPTNNFVGVDRFTYQISDGQSSPYTATVTIMVTPPGVLFCDNFTRPPGTSGIAPWLQALGNSTISNNAMYATTATYEHGYTYIGNANWTNYSVQAQIQFSTTNAWGGGIGGHLNPVSGAHYAAWVYPEGAGRGTAMLKLFKFAGWWSAWNSSPYAEVSLPPVGTNWHTLTLTFENTNIIVSLDGTVKISTSDESPYPSGGISLDLYSDTTAYSLRVANVFVIAAAVIANNDNYTLPANTILTMNPPGVLANDVSDGGSLTAHLVRGPAQGTLTFFANGSFAYTPTNNFIGADSFSYQAVTGTSTSAVATVTLMVSDALAITSQPTNVTVSARVTARFSVSATSTLPIAYQWFKNQTNAMNDGGNVSGSHTATLTLTNVLGADAGQYSVVVSDASNTLTSAAATLTIQNDLTIISQPVSLAPPAGSTASYTVNATGTQPISYQWLKNGVPLIDGGNISGSTTTNLVISFVSDLDVASYSAVVGNISGNVTSRVATLVIAATGGVLFADNFTRSTDPGSISPWVAAVGTWTVTGQTLTPTGLNSGLANAYMEGNWTNYSLQGQIQFPAGSYGGGLGGHVDTITGAHYGAWVYPEGSPGGSATLSLVKFFDWSNWSFTSMQQVSLTNGVGTGWHTINLAFKANEILVYYDGAKVVDVLDNDFDNLSPYSYGGITVDVWANSPAQAMVVSNVVVSDFPLTIINQPASTTSLAGSNVTFAATVSGTPPLSFQWFKNGTPLSDGGNISGSATASLTISNATNTDEAIYRLLVTDVFGDTITSSNATLTMTTIPVIASQPAGLTTVIGGTATLTVQAIGNGLNYQWLKNTNPITGATNTTLTFTNLALGDTAIYSVIVSNAFGTVISSNAVLIVLDCIAAPGGNVGWWPGDGTARDIIGTNNGLLQGGATAANAGVVGSCFNFDGANGYVEIPDSPLLHPTNLTIEAWVLFNSLESDSSNPGHQYIVFKQNSRGDQSGFEGFGLGKDRYPNVSNTNGDVLYFNVSSADGDTAEVDSTVIVATNVWYHVAGVRGPNYLQLYVNGQLQGQVGVSFPQDYGANSLYFGTTGQPQFFDGKLNGLLDEVSLYNRALTSSEITAIYLAGASGKCKGSTTGGNPPVITVQPVGLTHTLKLTFSTQNGLNYHLEFKDDIASPYNWQEMTNFFGDGNPASLSIPTDAPTMRFFRLRVQ